jgi:serine/threonine protein kinase
MPDNRKRDIEVFTEAIQLPDEQRLAFLDGACAGDADLRRRIEALLKSNDRAGDFLETPPTGSIGEGRAKVAVGEKSGDRVDKYKLLQQIGEGGCGVVFVAEQEEPVRRRVALKVVKPGMDTKSVIARFEAERQALALMDHPNIAHVFDAGATESGRPYFVMELVEGVKITDYCDRYSLPTDARLELFVQVCDAIQHAHQKGIIHRDIKPSNILVGTGPDGKPAPKVIDFGIAKATTGQQLTDKTIFTAFEMLIGTPAYMSPEQASLTSTDVDTRTDIYSLGVLLYELLTGTTPFDTRELLKAGLDEVRRVIRNEEPVRPSTRLSTMVGADLANFSSHHGADAPKLIREMRGELDWIVMKTLEKDRTRRYATAYGLALDIGRYLSGEAVLACPPSRLYQFRKLVSRHKLEFAAFGIVATSLVAALVMSTWSLRKEKLAHHEAENARLDANKQRKKAELGEHAALTEVARGKQAMDFLKQTLTGVFPNVSQGRDTSVLREMLDRAMTNLDLKLTNEPAVQADMKMTIGPAYIAIGSGDKAESLFREALAYYRKFPEGAEEHISDALSRLSLLHMTLRPPRLEEAEQEVREALKLEPKLSATPTMRLVVLETRLGWIKLLLGKAEAAEDIFRKALEKGQDLVGDKSEKLLDTRGGLARALYALDKFDDAEKVIRESIKIAHEKLGPEHIYVANELYRLAVVLERKDVLAEAETSASQSLAIRRKMLSMDHPLTDEALALLARILSKEQKTSEAVGSYRELLRLRQKKFGARDAQALEVVDALAEVLAEANNESQFEQLASEFPEAWVTKSEYLARRCRWPEARAAATKFLEIRPADDKGYHLMAPLLVQAGDRAAYDELCAKITTSFAGATNPSIADRMAKDCLILPRRGADLKVPGELAETAVTLGRGDKAAFPFFQCCKALAEYRQGNWETASNWAGQAAENPFPYSRAEALAVLAMAQHQLNQSGEARACLKKSLEVAQAQLPKPEDGDLGQDWRDWIIAHALQSEAKRMIDGETSSAARPANLPQ